MTDDLFPDEPADEEELRSAAALARALDGGRAEPELPREALETAALLRLSAGVDRLSDERRAEIRHEVLESLPPVSRARQRFVLPRWLMLALPLAGAAALSLLVLPRSPEPSRTSLPSAQPLTVEQLKLPSDRYASSSSADEAPSPAGAVEGQRSTGSDLEAPVLRESLASGSRAGAAIGGGSMAVEARRDRKIVASSPVALGAAPAARGVANMPQAAAPVVVEAPAAQRAERPSDANAERALGELGKNAGDQHVALLARVNDARWAAGHAEIDAARSRPELERSRDALDRTLEALREGLGPSDTHLARQDLYCRLAEAALRLGEPRTALAWTQQGIDLDGPPTPFLAQLLALEGKAWAALGDDTSAAASYMKALRMHEILLDESLDGR